MQLHAITCQLHALDALMVSKKSCGEHTPHVKNACNCMQGGCLAQWDGRHHTTPKSRVRAPVSSQVLGQPRCPRSDIKGGGGRVLL